MIHGDGITLFFYDCISSKQVTMTSVHEKYSAGNNVLFYLCQNPNTIIFQAHGMMWHIFEVPEEC